ncbi:hypothetical protein L226DRAFT_287529 [Lentinus tigrinus ALCF2SS1-7]|uniref:uncharacterized protein n=1 Tax=Lentinus tigrinus ALCF2SS1-7 TaxID=1328758 RepID=UPI00116621D1|nr:hypothetical protein L226DRAFT_287529 [Lentinus tigrinus ALCF2SS1-7]
MSETGERAYIDAKSLEGLEGTERECESLLGESSLPGDASSRIGSQIDRRCCSRIVPTVPGVVLRPGPPAPPASAPPSESRPMADELSAIARPRSSAQADQRACMLRRRRLRRSLSCRLGVISAVFRAVAEIAPRTARVASRYAVSSAGTKRASRCLCPPYVLILLAS